MNKTRGLAIVFIIIVMLVVKWFPSETVTSTVMSFLWFLLELVIGVSFFWACKSSWKAATKSRSW